MKCLGYPGWLSNILTLNKANLTMGQHHIGRHVMWRKGLELGVRRPSFSVWFIFSFMTNSLRAYQTLSPMLRSIQIGSKNLLAWGNPAPLGSLSLSPFRDGVQSIKRSCITLVIRCKWSSSLLECFHLVLWM